MLDTTMLGFLSSDTEVGFYSAGTKLGHMVLNMLTAITGVLLPRLTIYSQKGDMKSFSELSQKSACILILLSVPMAAGLFILAEPLMLLLSGSDYLPAIPAMRVIIPIIIIIAFSSLTGVQILPVIGREKISFYSYIAGAMVNVTLNMLFIPKFGALGAAIGTVCAESIVTLVQIVYVRKIIITKVFLVSFLESIFASFVMMFCVGLILKMVENLLLQLIVSFVVGMLVYATILWVCRNSYFLEYAGKVLQKLKINVR